MPCFCVKVIIALWKFYQNLALSHGYWLVFELLFCYHFRIVKTCADYVEVLSTCSVKVSFLLQSMSGIESISDYCILEINRVFTISWHWPCTDYLGV